MASSSTAARELQKELEGKANDLSKIQKGKSSPAIHQPNIYYWINHNILIFGLSTSYRYIEEPPSQKEVHHPTWWKRACPQGPPLSHYPPLLFSNSGFVFSLGSLLVLAIDSIAMPFWEIKNRNMDFLGEIRSSFRYLILHFTIILSLWFVKVIILLITCIQI